MVDVLRRYSRYSKLDISWQKIQAMSQRARSSERPVSEPSSSTIHKLDQRLEPDLVPQLVAEYEAGTPTTQLTEIFGISKGAVLKLLHEAGVSFRRQPLTEAELGRVSLLAQPDRD
jgi:hypothetical protein